MAVIIAVTSDRHVGHVTGLCPPEFVRDNGSTYVANKAQQWLWDKWLSFWTDVETLKQQYSVASVWHVMVGDAVDTDERTLERPISTPDEAISLSHAVLEPTGHLVNLEFWIRGTPVHVGRQAWIEERIAKERSKTVKNPETGSSSWYYLPLEAEGIKADFYHRPETHGIRPWTEEFGPVRQARIIRDRYTDAGRDLPDYFFFGHFHKPLKHAGMKKPVVVYMPSWQLPYEWIHSIGRGLVELPVGGFILICDSGKSELLPKLYYPKGTRRWTPDQLSQ